MSSNLFTLRDLPDGTWSVSWDKERWHGIYKIESQEKLLNILFDEFGLSQVELSTNRYRSPDYTEHENIVIDSTLWFQHGSHELAKIWLTGYCIDGVKFVQYDQAEQFLQYLEKLYLVKLLKIDYENSSLD